MLVMFNSFCLYGFSQSVGIGTTTPHISAQLEITSNSKGLLIPRLTKMERQNITTAATGLLVYQTDADSSFFWYNGAAWIKLLSTSSGWALNGNLNTTSSHFIGTIDKKPVFFKMNNSAAGKLDTSGSLSFGRGSLANNLPDKINTAFGDSALFNNSIGAFATNHATNNTAIGAAALKTNTTGFDNTATGSLSLKDNSTGFQNTATGFRSLQSNTTGFWNTATGWQSLFSNTTGTGNTGFGYQALNFTSTADYNTAVGHQSLLFNTTVFLIQQLVPDRFSIILLRIILLPLATVLYFTMVKDLYSTMREHKMSLLAAKLYSVIPTVITIPPMASRLCFQIARVIQTLP